jgi:WD40 repeat protein
MVVALRFFFTGPACQVKLWDTLPKQEPTRQEPLLTLRGQARGLVGLAFRPDGTRIAPAREAGTVKLWDTSSHQEALPLQDRPGLVIDAAFNHNGTRLLSVSRDTGHNPRPGQPPRTLFRKGTTDP